MNEQLEAADKENSKFYLQSAKLGRMGVKGYMRIAYRPKLIYANRDVRNLIKSGGNIIIANHVGHNDGQMLYTLFKGSTMLLAKDQTENPIVKWVTSGGDFILIDRMGEESGLDLTWLRSAMAMLKEGRNVIIFPEGHTSKSDIDEFRPGFATLAYMSKAKIVPVYIDGEYHPFIGKRLSVCVGEAAELSEEKKAFNADYLKAESKRFRNKVINMKGWITK